MKIEIIKEESTEYKTGDILSATNGYEEYTCMLFKHSNQIGLMCMESGIIRNIVPSHTISFQDLIENFVECIDATEWRVFKSDKCKLILGDN